MPVRRVSHKGGNIIGKFPSLKMARMIAFESLLERDYIFSLEYESEITWFEEQPLTIEYQYGGKSLHYTPDFHVVYSQHHTLVECKPLKFVTSDENLRKFYAARAWCQERDWGFHVVTELEIRRQPFLRNIKTLLSYARYPAKSDTVSRIYGQLIDAPNVLTVLDVARVVSPSDPATIFATILHLAFHHKIIIPLSDDCISPESQVYLK